jgi:hypothetical protein
MADHCLPQLHACPVRVARLDTNGVPLPGAENLYVSGALVRFGTTPVFEDGDEITLKNACGDLCVNYRGDDSFKRLDVTIELCTQDPFLSEMLSGGEVLTDGEARGYAAPALGTVTGNGISLELWTKRVIDEDLDPDFPYAWWVFPKIKNLRIGEKAYENGPLANQFTGRAVENPNWFDGPLNDWPATSDRVYQWIETTDKPVASCGFASLAAS